MIKQFIATINNSKLFLISALYLLAIVTITALLNAPSAIYFYFLVVPSLKTIDVNYAIQHNFSRKSIWQMALLWSVLQAGILILFIWLLDVVFHQPVSLIFYGFGEAVNNYGVVLITAIFAFLSGVTIQLAIYRSTYKQGVYFLYWFIYSIIIMFMISFFWLNNIFIYVPLFLIVIETIVLRKWFKSTDFISRFDLKQQLRNK
ncbi:hypothetical protein [Holzapfeliella sp. JNUCC 72]